MSITQNARVLRREMAKQLNQDDVLENVGVIACMEGVTIAEHGVRDEAVPGDPQDASL